MDMSPLKALTSKVRRQVQSALRLAGADGSLTGYSYTRARRCYLGADVGVSRGPAPLCVIDVALGRIKWWAGAAVGADRRSQGQAGGLLPCLFVLPRCLTTQVDPAILQAV